jgi:hypothetical protein
MWSKYLTFLRGIAVNGMVRLGIFLTSFSFLLFLFLELLRVSRFLNSALVGLWSYLLLPVLFLLGWILILTGWWRQRRNTNLSSRELLEQRFQHDEVKALGVASPVGWAVVFSVFFSLLFMGGATTRMLHFMEEPHFCGTACHSVMEPEWVSYRQSPHAHVACVECHVGEGFGAMVDAKLNGMWQMVSVSLNLFDRPIPTPVHQLRPARQTCEHCHWPEKFYGKRLLNITSYLGDENNTPRYTSLAMKVDAGSTGAEGGGIHWHVNSSNEIRYASSDDDRDEMIWVDALQADGSYKRFQNKSIDPEEHHHVDVDDSRTMDCVDCHNRATHIYEDPATAVDLRIQQDLISSDLPFIKREGLRAITHNYPNKEAGIAGIASHLEGFYRHNYPGLAGQRWVELDQAVEALQGIYDRNIHPSMNIDWGSYPSLLGHKRDGGCFRCHNSNLVADDGTGIDYDCVLCHSILAEESDLPFAYLMPLDEENKTRNYDAHLMFQEEFLGTKSNTDQH